MRIKDKESFIKVWQNSDKQQEKILFIKRDFSQLVKYLSDVSKNDVEVEVQTETQIYFSSDSLELLLRSERFPTPTLVIVRIGTNKRYRGIGTNILNLLKEYSVKMGFKRILLENANTDDSIIFAEKRGFTKVYKPFLEEMGLSNEDKEGDYEFLLN